MKKALMKVDNYYNIYNHEKGIKCVQLSSTWAMFEDGNGGHVTYMYQQVLRCVEQPKAKSLVSGSNAKLCVGDKVRVNEGICSGRVHLNPQMKKYIGKEFIIDSVTLDNVRLEGIASSWNWDAKWLTKVCVERAVYIKGRDNSALMEQFMDSYRNRKMQEKVYVYNSDGSYNAYANGIPPNGWSNNQYLSYSKVNNILIEGTLYCEPKVKACNKVTKEEWLIALIGGAIGSQSGNKDQRWRYNKYNGKFESKYTAGWESKDIGGLYAGSRTFFIVNEVVMTVKEIECELGIENLVVA